MRIWNLYVKPWVNCFFSPCVERERLPHNGYTYLTSTKKEPLNVKTSSTTCIKNSFRLRQDLFLCLGVLCVSTYNCAFLLWNALPRPCSASNQNKFKVLFPLLFFARLFSFKTNCKTVYESFSACKFFCWRNSKTNTQLGFSTLRLHPWNVFSLNTHQIYT